MARSSNAFWSAFKTPEVQFFIIFTVPFTAFFFINYFSIGSMYRLAVVIAFVATLIVVLLQTIYSLYAHSKAKEEESGFLNMTAHQIRTPLTAIRWTLQELGKKDIREEDRSELIRVAGIAGERLSNIIEAFSQVARLEEQITFHYQAVDLGEAIAAAVQGAEPIAKQYGSGVYFDRPAQDIAIHADPIKLEIVLSNLINNAIKYNRKGGMVTVRMRPLASDRKAEVTVEDTGIGISPADQKRLFEKYFRAENAKQANITGTGLGLYLVKAIITRHGGHIWVESLPGKGSAFHFTLPVER
jgi:signal transduction histidine kinase